MSKPRQISIPVRFVAPESWAVRVVMGDLPKAGGAGVSSPGTIRRSFRGGARRTAFSAGRDLCRRRFP